MALAFEWAAERGEWGRPFRGAKRDFGMLSAEGEVGEADDFATFECGFVGAKSDAGPVGGGDGIGPWFAIFEESAEHFVGEVWV